MVLRITLLKYKTRPSSQMILGHKCLILPGVEKLCEKLGNIPRSEYANQNLYTLKC